jgi:hypothetical protein
MAAKTKKQDDVKEKAPEKITFRCRSCNKYKPLEDMRIITRFFPLLVVCRDCEKEMY